MSAPIAIREVAVQYRGRRKRIPEKILGPKDVARFVRGVINGDAREHFVALLLDGRHRPIAYQVVSIGTATVACGPIASMAPIPVINEVSGKGSSKKLRVIRSAREVVSGVPIS